MHSLRSWSSRHKGCPPWVPEPTSEEGPSQVLGSAMDESVAASLREALDRYGVLVVHDQDLSPAALRDVTASFGPIFLHQAAPGIVHPEGVPEVMILEREPEGRGLFGDEAWHADVTFRRPGGHVTALHARIIPPTGGDTGFASTVAAFRALSPGLQALLRRMHGVHSYDGPGRPDTPGQTAIHPMVRRHPASGQEGLYFNSMFVTRFDGMSEAESRPLIDYLDRHVSRPEFTMRHRWRIGDVVFWDNRFTLHYPIDDFTGHRRLMLRCATLEA